MLKKGEIRMIHKWLREGMSKSSIARRLGISRETVRKYALKPEGYVPVISRKPNENLVDEHLPYIAAAGCMVLEGMLHRTKPIRVLRDDVVVFQGELESLRRYKQVVEEVRAGMECGLAVKGYKDIKVKDKIEVYDVQLIKRSL